MLFKRNVSWEENWWSHTRSGTRTKQKNDLPWRDEIFMMKLEPVPSCILLCIFLWMWSRVKEAALLSLEMPVDKRWGYQKKNFSERGDSVSCWTVGECKLQAEKHSVEDGLASVGFGRKFVFCKVSLLTPNGCTDIKYALKNPQIIREWTWHINLILMTPRAPGINPLLQGFSLYQNLLHGISINNKHPFFTFFLTPFSSFQTPLFMENREVLFNNLVVVMINYLITNHQNVPVYLRPMTWLILLLDLWKWSNMEINKKINKMKLLFIIHLEIKV